MQRSILKINITNELDVVLAYKRAMQLSERLGIALANQTKFATAVSEICRNVVEYVGNGAIQFSVAEQDGFNYLEALITDRGRGIGNLDHYLSNNYYSTAASRGTGIINSRKLADYFDIQTESEKGTRVTLRKRIPANASAVSKAQLDRWVHDFDEEADISPYAEIKKQNMHLLELLEQLRLRNLEAEQQLQEIRRLNVELQNSNAEIQLLSEERERKNLMLQRINADLDAFAHTVSHDLRAPLQNINGLTTVLEACLKADDPQEANQVFPLLREQTQKMDRLITGILTYSLAGHHNLRKQIVDLQVLLQKVVESLTVPPAFTIRLQPDLPVLYTQEIFLFQIFSNLISNAVKYHDQPEQAVIEVQYERQPGQLIFSVKDNGPGIPQEYQAQIFNQYEALGHNIARTDSTGLGLAIVQKIIKGKNGSVWVESDGRGSSFRFTWPLHELVQEEPQTT